MGRGSFSEKEILPSYSAGERFCYFLDLLTSSAQQNTSLARHKRMLAASADAGLLAPIRASLVVNSNNKNEVITSAIQFLTNVAASERVKEIQVIKRYLNEIKQNPIVSNILKNPTKGKDDLTNLIQDLEDFSNNPTNGKELMNFYSKLTLLINSIRNSIESFQVRLNQLLDKNRSTTREIRSDFFATRLSGDIDTLMRNLTGTVQREKESALSTRIVKLLISYVSNHLDENILFVNNPAEILIGIMIDFEKFLQIKYDQLGFNNILKLEEMDIESIFIEYTEKENTFLEQIRQNNAMVLTTLETIHREMGIRELKPQENEAKQRAVVLSKIDHSKSHSTNPRTRQAINKVLKANGRQEISNYLRWNVTTKNNNRHGTIYELILPVIENALKIGGHAATDVISVDIGTINIDIDIKNAIQKQVASMRTVIEEQAKLQRQNRHDDLIESIQQMNQDISDSIKIIDNILKENKIPEDVFIYHQSLKLYTQIEEHKTAQFHGREMQVLNMLDNLYSLVDEPSITLVDQDILYGAILNLSELALGHESKSMVENYLSIFAGLLMFDDIQNMSWDIARTTASEINSSGHAYNVHLYLVNDIYVPGSLVLTTISQALQQGYTHISAQNGAKVTIDTSEADEAIRSYLGARASGVKYDIQDWEDEAEAVAQGTKAQITFLSAFFTFLKDIQNYIN